MAKGNIHLYNTEAEYLLGKDSFELPNVSYCTEEKSLHYNPVVKNKLITFTISGSSYQAEEGMTWEEWVDSEYNTGGFTASGGIISHRFNVVSTQSGAQVTSLDKIIRDGIYYSSLPGVT